MSRPLTFLLGLVLAVPLSSFGGALHVTLADNKGKPVEDAVVSLVKTDGPMPAPVPLAHVEITQQGQQFSPYVTVITVGTPVVFPNKDTVQHHVYSLSKPKKFELPLYAPGKAETIVFDQPGLVAIGCNIHDWMAAYLVVLPTPWFAKTDAQGAATIEAPAGSYRLEIWHPRMAGPVTKSVVLTDGAGDPLAITLLLKPDRRVRRAPDGKSTGY
ncbi:MAG TPA: hypothetical protein VFJ90_09100 [Candidatus Didemnitutus sp.]|nr:hypothetical protein [Candidatus Didemnitutus sp.]